MADLIPLDMRLMQLAHEILYDVFKDDAEPIPRWEHGNRRLLETCCHSTEAGAFDVQKYPDLPAKAAKLFYSIIKSHPFPNGNKRMALVASMLLLRVNGWALIAGRGLGSKTAKWVAGSNPQVADEDPDTVVAALAEFFTNNIEERPL